MNIPKPVLTILALSFFLEPKILNAQDSIPLPNATVLVFTNDSSDWNAGSGWYTILDGRRVVVTNEHVIRGKDKFLVYFQNGLGRSFKAELIGADQLEDVAFLGLIDPDTKFLPKPLLLGNSDSLIVCSDRVSRALRAKGEECPRVYAETAPYYFNPRIFLSFNGYVVGTRERSFAEDFRQPRLIMIDFATLRGSSGSALKDESGRVVGMIVGTLSSPSHERRVRFGDAVFVFITESNQFSMVIPVNDIMKIWPRIKKNPGVRSLDRAAFIGDIVPRDCDDPEICILGRAYISEIGEEGLKDIDLRVGDVLIAIDKDEIRDIVDFSVSTMLNHLPGDKVKVTILRKDGNGRYREIKIEATLGTLTSVGR